MQFWSAFSVIGVISYFSQFFIPIRYRQVVPIAFSVWLIFISGFRYMIGFDYEGYIDLFYNVNIGDIYPEISFILLSTFLRNLGFDYQAMFLVYAFFTIVFIYLGCRYWVNNTMLAMLLYALIPYYYWFSMNGIRQGLAISIVFWGTKYILNRNFTKYVAVVIIASFIHTSAIITIINYWIVFKRFTIQQHVLIVLASLFLFAINIIPDVFTGILTLISPDSIRYIMYVDALEESINIKMLLLNAIFWLIILLASNKLKDNKYNVFLNMVTLSFIIACLLSFSQTLSRTRTYYDIFIILGLAVLPNLFKDTRYRYSLVLLLILYSTAHFLFSLSNVPTLGSINSYYSASNIIYEFNFKLFQ